MFGYEPWTFIIVALLPLVGFYLGVRFRPVDRPPRPETLRPDETQSEQRILDAIEALREEVSELADRQDFAERLLARQQSVQLPQAQRRVVTPV